VTIISRLHDRDHQFTTVSLLFGRFLDVDPPRCKGAAASEKNTLGPEDPTFMHALTYVTTQDALIDGPTRYVDIVRVEISYLHNMTVHNDVQQ
jgi:hypothetical protein